MKKFMDFMSDKVAPKLQKISSNPWITGMQRSIMITMPLVFVGSLITVYNVLRNYMAFLPDLSAINQHTFGLMSLFISFLLPYFILDQKKNHKMKFVAGMTGLALFMLLVNPKITDAGYVYQFSNFGAGGMFVAIIAGLFSAMVFNGFAKISFFGEDSAMPDFVKEWFDTMLPTAVVIFVGWLLVKQFNIDLYTVIVNLFMPLVDIANSYPGFVLLYFIPTVLYSMGISGWVFQPILNPVSNMGLAANAAAVAAGQLPQYAYAGGTATAWLSLGGRGSTLPLVVMMAGSKSRKLKTLGRVGIVPSIMNINEPVIFGAVAWNPLLMVPMWLNGFIIPTITYIFLKTNIVPIPYEVFSLWYLPIGVTSFLVSKEFMGILLVVINLLVATAIWYPFFKLYEKQEIQKEAVAAE